MTDGPRALNQLRLFRILIGAQIALVVMTVAAGVRLERTLPAPLQAYLKALEDAPFDKYEVARGGSETLALALLVVAWIALLRFWRIAPWLYLASLIVMFLAVLGSGPSVETAIETALETAWSMIGGVILSMSFFSELRGKFGAGRAPKDL